MGKSLQIAIYGKGGIGKSTIAANISAALAANGRRVLQVGCDPKHDSTRLLLRGQTPPTVLDYIRDMPPDNYSIDDIIMTGEFGVDCAEAGGPEPGIGCAGRGILTTFDLLDKLGVTDRGYDVIIYDVLGDVVCGGFAVPIRNEYSDRVYIITSGEFMSLYAANNILRGLANYETDRPRVGGIIFNARGGDYEEQRVFRFAEAVCLPIVETIPRDDTFALSERAFRCLVAEFSDSDLAKHFYSLAETVLTGLLYSARPVTDEELELKILSTPIAGNGKVFESDLRLGIEAVKDIASSASDSDPTSTASNTAAPTPLLSKSLVYKEPLHGCAFNGAISITTQLTDCVSIAHGPKSCAHIAFQAITSISRRLLLERGIVLPMQTAPPIVSTDMSESVMIFGGASMLEQRIRDLQKVGPPAIFVISTCPSGIIGEDILATAALSTSTTQVIPIATDGNLTGDHLQGVFLGYQHIAEALIDRDVTPEPDLVNIVAEKTIAESTTGNLNFIKEILERLDLRLNCRFICESSYEQIRGFMRAPINLLANGDYMGTALRDYLEQSFGAHFFEKAFPIGFADSSEWVRNLAALYNRPEAAELIIEDYAKRYQAMVNRLRPQLSGRRLMVITFNHDIDWILSTAIDVGMEIGFVGILNYSQDHGFNTEYSDQIGELNTNLDYTAMTRLDDVMRIQPDVLIGNYLPSGSLKVPVTDTIQLCPDVGFLAGIQMSARWAEMLRLNIGEGWRQDADLYRKYHS
ncbi:MAG: AAA family ATPase [Coriobacteriales bacterium]|jgi:nitrogenase iron protein|nr:AAA family ATPase [Coriobacteriales bacterium]